MDTWAKTISLDSDTQPLLEDNNNNNYCAIAPQLSQECKYEEGKSYRLVCQLFAVLEAM